MSTIEMIAVSNVHLLNPRVRNKIKFSEIVKNIAAIGLKKPIIVAPREEEPGTYDLVCGQGRLEAYQALGQTLVPALIRVVAKHDRYIMSLVENIARCQLQPMELVRELRALRDRGNSNAEIALKIGVSEGYVSQLMRLADNGEERLIRAVERGEIPLNVAVEIAVSDDAAIQQSLADAYTSKQLRGKKLLAARRLVEERRTRGKEMRTGSGRHAVSKLTADKLVRTYRKECARQRRLAKKARVTEMRLTFVSNALKQLLGDESFVNLLRAEKLDEMPDYLAETMRRAS
jgi:ParB family chromosome partitioning protein